MFKAMKKTLFEAYQSPQLDMIDVLSEGILCDSFSQLEEIVEVPGLW